MKIPQFCPMCYGEVKEKAFSLLGLGGKQGDGVSMEIRQQLLLWRELWESLVLLPASKRCASSGGPKSSLEAGHVVRVVVRTVFVYKKIKNNGTILLLPHPTHVCVPCEEPQ